MGRQRGHRSGMGQQRDAAVTSKPDTPSRTTRTAVTARTSETSGSLETGKGAVAGLGSQTSGVNVATLTPNQRKMQRIAERAAVMREAGAAGVAAQRRAAAARQGRREAARIAQSDAERSPEVSARHRMAAIMEHHAEWRRLQKEAEELRAASILQRHGAVVADPYAPHGFAGGVGGEGWRGVSTTSGTAQAKEQQKPPSPWKRHPSVYGSVSAAATLMRRTDDKEGNGDHRECDEEEDAGGGKSYLKSRDISVAPDYSRPIAPSDEISRVGLEPVGVGAEKLAALELLSSDDIEENNGDASSDDEDGIKRLTPDDIERGESSVPSAPSSSSSLPAFSSFTLHENDDDLQQMADDLMK